MIFDSRSYTNHKLLQIGRILRQICCRNPPPLYYLFTVELSFFFKLFEILLAINVKLIGIKTKM